MRGREEGFEGEAPGAWCGRTRTLRGQAGNKNGSPQLRGRGGRLLSIFGDKKKTSHEGIVLAWGQHDYETIQ